MRFRLDSSLPTATDERSNHSGDLHLARCTTMRAIVEQTARRVDSSGRFRIDVWFLDVEGSELQVLRSIDWDWVGISVIVVEQPTSNLASQFSERNFKYDFHSPVPTLLYTQGFLPMYQLRGDVVWVHADASQLLDNLRPVDYDVHIRYELREETTNHTNSYISILVHCEVDFSSWRGGLAVAPEAALDRMRGRFSFTTFRGPSRADASALEDGLEGPFFSTPLSTSECGHNGGALRHL
jgi:hypothetical protein